MEVLALSSGDFRSMLSAVPIVTQRSTFWSPAFGVGDGARWGDRRVGFTGHPGHHEEALTPTSPLQEDDSVGPQRLLVEEFVKRADNGTDERSVLRESLGRNQHEAGMGST